MKQQMDEESIEALVSYRLQRAKETLHEADILIKDSCYNAAVNRLYYACYYAVITYLNVFELFPYDSFILCIYKDKSFRE